MPLTAELQARLAKRGLLKEGKAKEGLSILLKLAAKTALVRVTQFQTILCDQRVVQNVVLFQLNNKTQEVTRRCRSCLLIPIN